MAPRFEAQAPGDARQIQGYREGGFIVSGEHFVGAVMVTPEQATSWGAVSLEALSEADFTVIFAANPQIDVLLIGTGQAMRRPPAALLTALRARGIAPEFMDSRAAARTYNVLVNDARRVAAALLPL